MSKGGYPVKILGTGSEPEPVVPRMKELELVILVFCIWEPVLEPLVLILL